MDCTLPVVDAEAHRIQPWLLHVLDVNALNFCAFAVCDDEDGASEPAGGAGVGGDGVRAVLVAVPNAVDSGGVWWCALACCAARADGCARSTCSSCLRRNASLRSWETRRPILVSHLLHFLKVVNVRR